jgi:carbamoyltransferase
MNILGISAFYHDSAACLVRDGMVVAAAQEERFTRKKHDWGFPHRAVEYCLREGGIAVKDLDLVAFYDKPFLKFERILETHLAYAPQGLPAFIQAMPVWIKQKIWVKQVVQDELKYSGKMLFPEHHESHAASAFFPSPYPRAAFLTVDGVGEWTTTSYGVGRDNRMTMMADISFPHSLGLLYSAFTAYTGFKVNSGEYKLMGLAPYGEPRFKQLILDHLIDVREDGSFRMNMDYFSYCAGLTMTNSKFHALFGGPPRRAETRLTQREMDLARSVQEALEEILLKIIRHIHRVTGEDYLCLAGGVALNCVANGRLLREGPFKDIWIQPASSDAGGALGAALYAWHQYLDKPRTADGIHDTQRGSLLGPGFSDDEIGGYLNEAGIRHRKLTRPELVREVADFIVNEKVIAWFQGRMEFGPRALGARSILGDARSPRLQETMNLKIKFRESFRPFAPIVKADRVSDYFELDRPSPYMMLVAPVKTSRRREVTEAEKSLFGIEKLKIVRSDIPAVTHVDYSARIQTVDAATNPLLHELLSDLEKRHGTPVIINTSFNVRGEPIVCTPQDAYRCFMRTNMDYLVMGSFVIDKREQPELKKDNDWKKEFELD